MEANLKFINCGYVLLIILVGPVILVSPSNSDDKACNEVSSEECLEKLQTFLRLKSLPFTSDEDELDKLCMNTMAGYNCSSAKANIPNCLNPGDKELFPIFTSMAEFTIYMFCTTGSGNIGYLREALLENAQCIMNQKESLDCCAEGSKLVDLPVMYYFDKSLISMEERQKAACCPIANYLKCAVSVVENKCGQVAGNLTKEYVRRSSGEQLESVCQKLPGFPEPNSEICETKPPVCSGSQNRDLNSGGGPGTPILLDLMVLMSLLFITRMSCM